MKRGAPRGYVRYEHWPRIQNALASHPMTVRAHPAHGRVYVQHDGHGTIGAVWAARRTT